MAGTTVTTLAKKKMVKARAGISSLPKIVGMAFGDGGVDSDGTVKPHSADQNTLHHELLRKNVDGYEVLSDTKIRYRCTLAENELANTYISEVGLYDADGDMVAMKAFLKKGKDADMGLVFHGQNLIKRCYSGKTVTIRNVSTRIRASIFLKARRKIHRFAKKIKNKKIIGSKFAMSTIAYNGWFVTTDSFLVRVAECWDQLISMAKNIISRYAKQKSYATSV